MARKTRYLIGAMVILLSTGVAVGIVITLARAERRARLVKLTGGRSAEVLAALKGHAEFTTETKYERLARRFLPESLQGLIPEALSASCGQNSNSLTLYLRIAGASPGARFSIEAEDQNGFRYLRENHVCESATKSDRVYGLALTAYPRRQAKFLVHLLNLDTGAELGSFPVTNAPGHFPEWQPSRLPITVTNGPVKLTLQSLDIVRKNTYATISARWHLEAIDPAWENAVVAASSTFSDSTGNEAECLSPGEKAWKFRAVVKREHDTDFSPEEQIQFANLVPPSPGSYVPIGETKQCAGVSLRVLALAGAGTFGTTNETARTMIPQVDPGFGPHPALGDKGQPSENYQDHVVGTYTSGEVATWTSTTPFLLVEVRDLRANGAVRFDIRDENGRDLETTVSYSSNEEPGERLYKLAFDPREAKSVTLHGFVNRALEFEFLVDPKEVRMVKE